MENQGKEYDLFLGTSTGSLMVSHLALGMLDELKELYTNVNQDIYKLISSWFIKPYTAKIARTHFQDVRVAKIPTVESVIELVNQNYI